MTHVERDGTVSWHHEHDINLQLMLIIDVLNLRRADFWISLLKINVATGHPFQHPLRVIVLGAPPTPRFGQAFHCNHIRVGSNGDVFFSRIHCSALQYALHHPMALIQLNGILCLAIWINIFTLDHVGICTSPWTKGRWDPMTQGAEFAESLRPAVFCICSTVVCFSLRLVLCFLHLAYVTWSLVIGHHWSILVAR